MYKISKAALIAGLFVAFFCENLPPAYPRSADTTAPQRENFPVFPTDYGIEQEVISPNNSDIVAIINNRPISIDRSVEKRNERWQAIGQLKKAFDCSKSRGNYKDMVDCLSKLGSLYYLEGELGLADTTLDEAIAIARRKSPVGSPIVAPLNDLDALVVRELAAKETKDSRKIRLYKRAEKLLMESLGRRSGFFGYYNADCAHSLMNLALLFRDRATEHLDSPSERKVFEQKAIDLEFAADELMNSNPDEYSRLMNKAIEARNRGLRESDPNKAFELEKTAEKLIEDAKKFRGVQINGTSCSHGFPRPFVPCMTANPGYGVTPNIFRFANEIISKCPKPEPPKRPDGLATIFGNWSIATDVVDKQVTKTMHRTEVVPEGELEVTEKRSEEKVTPVEGVSIYLCRYPENPNNILSRLKQYGSSKGLFWTELGQKGTTYGWPASHEQAKEIISQLDGTAAGCSFEIKSTNKEGDYEFRDVPKGTYMLFASVCTKKNARIWFIPAETIKVTRVQQFRFDFIEKTGIRIWEDGHPAAPMTPPSFFYGTSVVIDEKK